MPRTEHVIEGTWWIDRGVFSRLPGDGDHPFSDRDLPFRVFGLVCLREAHGATLVRWDIDHASEASLDAALATVAAQPAPVRLEFFKSGWAVEHHGDGASAARRMDELRDVRLMDISRTAFIRRRDPGRGDGMAPLLRRALRQEDTEVARCQLFYDYRPDIDDFVLTRVGAQAGLVAVLGRQAVIAAVGSAATPNQSADYDRAVVPPYFRVFRERQPHYDFVTAALAPPGQEPVWASYQRLIQPYWHRGACVGVCVTSQIVRDPVVFLAA